MIISNISVPLLGMVDTGVTGHLDDAVYLAAVAIGSTIFSFLYSGVNFLRMGTTGITAQRYGANDNDGLKVALGQAIVVALIIAAVLIVLQKPLGNIAIRLLGPESEVGLYAREYFSIRIWSAPATLANYALIGWFIGLHNVRIPLYIVLVINITNIALDLLFVVVLGMKVDGVAAASVVGEFAGLAVGFYYVISEFRKRGGHMHILKLTSAAEYAHFFSVNANLFIRTMALMFTFAFVTAAGARLGSLILAANAVLMNLLHLISFALDGFAHAAEALVGKAVGEKDMASLQRSVSVTLRWSLYVAAVSCGIFFVGGPTIIRLLTDLPEVVNAALIYLPWVVALPIVAVWAYLYDGVFVGATRAREMRNIMVISALLVFLPAWYVLRPFGNHGLWLALTIFLASRGIGMHYYYRRHVLKDMAR
ncbi:MAG: MATE family multidrug resistance protein [Woeseiaceae bacterium]|jgi:MATE family multidrug resistance protein